MIAGIFAAAMAAGIVGTVIAGGAAAGLLQEEDRLREENRARAEWERYTPEEKHMIWCWDNHISAWEADGIVRRLIREDEKRAREAKRSKEWKRVEWGI